MPEYDCIFRVTIIDFLPLGSSWVWHCQTKFSLGKLLLECRVGGVVVGGVVVGAINPVVVAVAQGRIVGLEPVLDRLTLHLKCFT